MKRFTPTYVFKSIADIDDSFFKREKIHLVLLDIDNTLVEDNEPKPSEYSLLCIEKLKRLGLKLCLVSNNTKERVDAFNEGLGLYSVYRAHKPLGRKLESAIVKMGEKKENSLLIGDQLLTDIAAGNGCGIRTALVSPIDTSRENRFFKFKRFIENKIFLRNF